MDGYVLGIDIGTSACKVALFLPSGEVAGTCGADYPVYYPREGWAEQNPADWWAGVCRAVRGLLAKTGIRAGDIAGIGVDGQSWSAVAVDAAGECLAPTPIWLDTRAQGICDRLNREVGAERIFRVAGNALQPSYTTAKILWYKEKWPEVYAKTAHILQCNSYIAYRLTGALTQDVSQGYGLHCFDSRKGQWDADMAGALGIDLRLLPELYPCHAVIGGVTKEAAAATGLAEGTPVVAGGLDAACGALGTGVLEPGETQEQGGQAGGMSICLDSFAADPRLILGMHVVPGRYLLQGGTTGGGGVMRWLEKELGAFERQAGAAEGKSALDLFNELAAAVPPGSEGLVFLPYMAGERSPIWNPKAKGVYYGLDFSKTKGHLIRAAMEGVAFALKHNLDVAAEAGAEVKVLRAMGGSANSLLWTQIKADVTGRQIVVPASDTATTLGAAILAGVGVGVYGSFAEAVRRTVHNKREHSPNQQHREVYDTAYAQYRALYEHLADMMR